MIFLWNPTQDDMPFQYAGLSYTLIAGKRMKVDEAMGNHVLNSMGPRGMTRLVFNDEGKSINEEQIAEEAVERNRDFKIRQIYIYNEQNERRKMQNQTYNPPTKQVKKWAAELGIQLLQPYNLAEAEKGQIGKLTAENAELKTALATLTEQVQALIAMQTAKNEPSKKDEQVRCTKCNKWVIESKLEEHMREVHKGG